MQVKQFVRRPFTVDAVQVTEENMEDVAKWCGGDVRTLKAKIDGDEHEVGSKFIKVRVYRPMGERQTMAFVDDWVLYAGKGYKVYTDPAFTKTFEEVKEKQEHDRSAITGQFVTAKDALASPETTIHESS